jgi:hypothetical protein
VLFLTLCHRTESGPLLKSSTPSSGFLSSIALPLYRVVGWGVCVCVW